MNTYMASAPAKLAISRRTWLASASSMATRLTRYFVCSPHARACGQPLAFGKLSVLFVDSSEIIVALPTIESFVSDEGTHATGSVGSHCARGPCAAPRGWTAA